MPCRGVANYAPLTFTGRAVCVIEGGYRTWMCTICGWTYDEARGAPEEGLAPGTRWEDIPGDWVCPDCGAAKEDFEMVEF
jgi:rubredoxin